MNDSRSFQKSLIIINALFSGAFIILSLILTPDTFSLTGSLAAAFSLGISLMILLLDWLDHKYLPTEKKDKADKEAQEWKNYLSKIKKELLSDRNSS